MNIPMFKTGDKILIICLAVIAVLMLAWNTFGVRSNQSVKAVITQNGSIIKEINLNDLKKPESVYINEPVKQVIRAEKGKIRFVESDCPNKTCVKTGWLTKAGDRAVCIPSKVVVTIVGENNKIDTFAY
ncbi:MAG: NusG domain II-containing protein [Syntrophomonas sp.]